MVDGHRLIHEVPAALIFARVHTDATTHQGKRIGLFDDPNGAQVIALCDLADVNGDFNACRAGPLARGRAFLGGVLPLDPPRVGGQGDDVFWANPLAGAATRALGQVHHGQVVGAHGKGVKGTCPCAGSQTDAADGADLGPAVKQDGGPAVMDPLIDKLAVRVPVPVSAPGSGHIGLSCLQLDP